MMWNLLKPSRQKIGIFTLLLTCLFAALWIRSLRIHDEITIGMSRTAYVHELETVPNALKYGRGELLERGNVRWRFSTRSIQPTDLDPSGLFFGKIQFHFRFLGFEFFSSVFDQPWQSTWEFVVVPWWSIVVPLTLVSCWLLLSKRRPTNSAAPVEITTQKIG